jgi:hypothetical protein
MKAPAAILMLLVGLIAFPGVGSPREESIRSSDHFWAHFAVQGLEVERYAHLAALATSSDAVILGRVTSVKEGRIAGNELSGFVAYATIAIEVGEVLRSSLPIGTTVSLEVMVPERTILSDVAATLPAEDALFFLRNKGLEVAKLGWSRAAQELEWSYYRLAVSDGLFRNFDGRARVAIGAEADFVLAWEGRPFGDLVAEVSRSLR